MELRLLTGLGSGGSDGGLVAIVVVSDMAGFDWASYFMFDQYALRCDNGGFPQIVSVLGNALATLRWAIPLEPAAILERVA